MSAKKPGGKPVKRAHLDRLWADQFRDPPAHLVGGLNDVIEWLIERGFLRGTAYLPALAAAK
jgi:hypothetical protein